MHKRILHTILYIILFSAFSQSSAKAQTILRIDSALNMQVNSLIETDVNGDGLLDIAGVSSSTLVWYKNLGDSITRLPFKFTPLSSVGILRAADMDGDNDIDFVIGDYINEYIDWIENIDGTGTLFTQHSISAAWAGTGPRSIDLSDINNDGSIDIVSNWGTSNLLIYSNNGETEPVFTQQLINIGTSDPYYLRVLDFDNDTDLDIFYYANTLDQIIYLENSGAGIFDIPGAIFYTGARVLTLKFTDMDLDLDPDMLIGFDYLAGNPAFELYQNNDGEFMLEQQWDFPYDVVGITTAHFNSDSLPEIVTLFSNSALGADVTSLNEIGVFLNNDSMTFTSAIIPLLGIIPDRYNDKVSFIAIGDLDVNGTEDIVLSDYNMLLVATSSDTAEQIFTKYQEIFRPRSNVSSVAEIQMADSISYILMIDNHLDVYQYRNEMDIIYYERTIEQCGTNKDPYSKLNSAIVFDIDNDGFEDDLFTSGGRMFEDEYGEYQWNTYRNVTNPEIEKLNDITPYNCINPFVADLNGDGFLDILAADGQLFWVGYDYDGFDIYDQYDAYFWLKNIDGSGNFVYVPLPGGYFDNEGFPIASDVDFDGDLDVLVYNQSTDNLDCYYNSDAAGTFDDRVTLATITNGQYICPRDIDGDGLEDIVINTSGDLIKWLRHTGPGIYDPPKTMCYYAKIRQPERLKFADINNDGFDDLISGTVNTQIYLNTNGYGFYPFPAEFEFNYTNRSIVDLNQNGKVEIGGVYNTNYAYARELDPLPAFPIIQFTSFTTSLDEDHLLADTLFIALSKIPEDTLIFIIFPSTLTMAEFEVQLNDGDSDTTQFIFLPDSTALINQQVIIRAIDDDEVDEMELGRISYSINTHEGYFELAGEISREYTIIDNDAILPDSPSNLSIQCNDSLINEGTFGTACNIKLNLPIEYPVSVKLITDNQLDVGAGPQDSIIILLTKTELNQIFYVDAVSDTITEGNHFGTLLINLISEDDNFDDVSDIVTSFNINDNSEINPEEPSNPEISTIDAWYIPETQTISLQYNLQENDAVVSLININGEIVSKMRLNSASGETTISTDFLPEGYYYLMINSIRNHFLIGKMIMVY